MTLSTSGSPRPVPLGLASSFGFGDRTGLATPGHLAALQNSGGGIRGIFAQQSIREMTRTHRTPEEVMSAAASALAARDYSEPWGADADHLKTPEDVQVTAQAGFVFYTIDPSPDVDQTADLDSESDLREKFSDIREEVGWTNDYSGTLNVPNGPKIEFDELTVLRAAVKYGRAINRVETMAEVIRKTSADLKQPFEIEISVDETDHPTSLAEHYIIADQLRRRNVPFISLAPRFIGELEKGVDYKGDIDALDCSLQEHAAIARALGPYKLSLHSGSDKLSIYPSLARATQGQFHVKTAGTSYLEALRVMSHCAPREFRELVRFCRERYDTDKATYHVSATLDSVASPASILDRDELEDVYLQKWEDVPEGHGFTAPGRQILHCTFGSVMTQPEFGPLLHQILVEHVDLYTEFLEEHFSRHLRALNS